MRHWLAVWADGHDHLGPIANVLGYKRATLTEGKQGDSSQTLIPGHATERERFGSIENSCRRTWLATNRESGTLF